MRRIGERRWPVSTIPILVALAATDCGAPAAPSATGTPECTASFMLATLLPPGSYTSTSAAGVKLYATETVELTNTSTASCYVERPTLMEVSVPSGLEDVGSLSIAPSRVDVLPATSVRLDFGSLAGCSTFEPPIWATRVTVTFPRLGSLRLGGMHMLVQCGAPLLLSFHSMPAARSPG